MIPRLQETVFYQDPYPVFISPSRVVIGPKTYITHNITSIGMASIPPTKGPVMAFAIIGFILLAGGLVFVFLNPTVAVGLLLVGAPLAIIGLTILSFAKPRYALKLVIAGGNNEFDVLVSPSQSYIQNIVNAINMALAYKN